MREYIVYGDGTDRVLLVHKSLGHRYKFYTTDSNAKKIPVKFKLFGCNLMAAVSDIVFVYQKPNSHTWHYEVMRHNARSLWLGLQPDYDRLENNLLEFLEII